MDYEIQNDVEYRGVTFYISDEEYQIVYLCKNCGNKHNYAFKKGSLSPKILYNQKCGRCSCEVEMKKQQTKN